MMRSFRRLDYAAGSEAKVDNFFILYIKFFKSFSEMKFKPTFLFP